MWWNLSTVVVTSLTEGYSLLMPPTEWSSAESNTHTTDSSVHCVQGYMGLLGHTLRHIFRLCWSFYISLTSPVPQPSPVSPLRRTQLGLGTTWWMGTGLETQPRSGAMMVTIATDSLTWLLVLRTATGLVGSTPFVKVGCNLCTFERIERAEYMHEYWRTLWNNLWVSL